MAAEKKRRPRQPRAKETDRGVEITYPDRVLPPPLVPLKKLRHCAKCGAGPVASSQRYGVTATAYLFECPRCVDPETCRPTRWQEPR